ncbi:D-alanyl-D-alanine carboxypeptidase family protein [Bacillus carboniphilus]|uniref:D-alanyl-D-alanine carboxypeptidase family protein n=1 Tax=Bacillus carboniphilus TaxID=86663 RepID=UPI003531E870
MKRQEESFFEKNSHKPMRIASITKIMTAIIAIESGKMNEEVKISKQAVETEGSSIYLQEGEKIKLEHLVYGLMLRSGNDAAAAIAEHVGGSLDGFAYLMNEKANQVGMFNTHFANPHGLDDHENHYSTAYDMAILTQYAMKNEQFEKVFRTKTYSAPNPTEKWDRTWRNKNKLLTSLYDYSTGGKTGYTKKANRTLVSTASKDNLDLIAVTLDDPDDWNDHINMFESTFDLYNKTTIQEEGFLANIDDSFYKDHLFVNRNISYPLTEDEKKNIKVKIDLKKPNKKWERSNVPSIVGTYSVLLNNDLIQRVPVYYNNGETTPPKRGFFESLKRLFVIFVGVGDG